MSTGGHEGLFDGEKRDAFVTIVSVVIAMAVKAETVIVVNDFYKPEMTHISIESYIRKIW